MLMRPIFLDADSSKHLPPVTSHQVLSNAKTITTANVAAIAPRIFRMPGTRHANDWGTSEAKTRPSAQFENEVDPSDGETKLACVVKRQRRTQLDRFPAGIHLAKPRAQRTESNACMYTMSFSKQTADQAFLDCAPS